MDLPLYTSDTRTELSDQVRTAYMQFDKAFTLTQVMRQAGNDPGQVRFRDILLRLRNADVTQEDWEELMKQTPTNVADLTPFADALHLYPTVEAVMDHNIGKTLVSLLPPSRLSTLELMQPRPHLMMLVAWKLLSALPNRPESCSPVTPGWKLASSMEQWASLKQSAIGVEAPQTCHWL